MKLAKQESYGVYHPTVVRKLCRHLAETNRNPADLLSMPDYAKDRDLLLAIAIQSFLDSLKSEKTKKDYLESIKHFAVFLQQTREANLLDAIGLDVALWREDLKKTGGMLGALQSDETKRAPNSLASIETKTSALSSFYDFLTKPGFYDSDKQLIKHNPVSALPKRHSVSKFGRSKKLSVSAFKQILKQIDLQSLRGLRDFCLLYGFYITGRRHSEWVKLQWKSIAWEGSSPIYKYVGKGGKTFTDRMPSKLAKVLSIYLRARWGKDLIGLTPDTYLFTSLSKRDQGKNQHLAESTVVRMIKKYARKAQLENADQVVIHSLRHLHAEAYLLAGANVETVRSRLRHQNLDTTQVYASTMDAQKNDLAAKLADRLLPVSDKTS